MFSITIGGDVHRDSPYRVFDATRIRAWQKDYAPVDSFSQLQRNVIDMLYKEKAVCQVTGPTDVEGYKKRFEGLYKEKNDFSFDAEKIQKQLTMIVAGGFIPIDGLVGLIEDSTMVPIKYPLLMGDGIKEDMNFVYSSYTILCGMIHVDRLAIKDKMQKLGYHVHVDTSDYHFTVLPVVETMFGYHRDLFIQMKRFRNFKLRFTANATPDFTKDVSNNYMTILIMSPTTGPSPLFSDLIQTLSLA